MREDATSTETPALQARAMDNLDYIRSTMERRLLAPRLSTSCCSPRLSSSRATPAWLLPSSP